MQRVTIYTDGACDGNPGPGGYGAILIKNSDRKEIAQGYRLTTNNRMEIMAVLEALKSLEKPSEVTVYTDSKYVADSINQGWVQTWRESDWVRKGGKRVPNADLWRALLQLIEMHDVEFKWVRGHAGVPGNERADALSYAAIDRMNPIEDEGYLQELELEQLAPSKITKAGQPCRKCGTPVVRKTPKRKRRSNQAYYYEYYLYCPECQTTYMVEDAKREIDQGKLFE
jgi:ribonuclease HI